MSIDYTVGVHRRATGRDIEKHTEASVEAVEGRNPEAQLAFAEHLIDQGLLGYGLEELTLELSLREMVARYAETKDGQAELRAWAQALAEEQLEAGIAA